MKHTEWICIAWKKLPSRDSVTKRVLFPDEVDEQEALRQFKKDFPKLRNHTVQPAP